MRRRFFAPAKLNLCLHVLGRRADGYHLLDSLVAFAAIGDEVTAERAAKLSLSVSGPAAASLAGPPADNLVWRAAELLARREARPAAAALGLLKNLPVASGIGGGSSDAAAALRALAELWGIAWDEAAMMAVAGALGADVPACLVGHALWLGGIGDRIEPAPPLPKVTALLANPGIPLPTAAVFRSYAPPYSAPARFPGMPDDAASLAGLLAERRNDLTAAATRLVPEIGAVLDRLAALEGALLARMSGSGATCFALFAEETAAQAAVQLLARDEPQWWVAAGRLS